MSKENENLKYEMIFGENRKQMKRISVQFKTNYENRENININNPRDPQCDPLISLLEISYVNINLLTTNIILKIQKQLLRIILK